LLILKIKNLLEILQKKDCLFRQPLFNESKKNYIFHFYLEFRYFIFTSNSDITNTFIK